MHLLLIIEIIHIFLSLTTGIEPIGNTAGNPARFIVETFSAGRGEVEVIVINPRGTQEPVRF